MWTDRIEEGMGYQLEEEAPRDLTKSMSPDSVGVLRLIFTNLLDNPARSQNDCGLRINLTTAPGFFSLSGLQAVGLITTLTL